MTSRVLPSAIPGTDWRSALQAAPMSHLLLVLALALSWLLPNHYRPWPAFHSNAWMAGVLGLGALWLLAGRRGAFQLSAPMLFLVGVAAVPWLQHFAGLVALRSDALVSSLYLAGFAAAFAFGQQGESGTAGRPAQWVLLAAAAAALVSVGIQIYQWLGFAADQGIKAIWIMDSDGARPYANFGQPNQLASLLLWGLLGIAWAWHRRWLPGKVASGLAAYILFGVALTESRTALLTLSMGTLLLLVLRPAIVERPVLRATLWLYGLYVVFLFAIEPLGQVLGVNHALEIFQRSGIGLRGGIWRAAWDAAWERPWTGFGWNHSNEALLAVAPRHAVFRNLYTAQSHNLVLDLILWVGWPVFLLLAGGIALWFWRVVRSVRSGEQLLMVAAVMVLAMHAMLELPLQYGYFLWPLGILAGAASAQAGFRSFGVLSRGIAIAVIAGFMMLLAVIVRDYLNIEAAFAQASFQALRVGKVHDQRPPETVLLTDWTEVIVMSRTVPTAGMNDAQIQQWKDLLIYHVSPWTMRKVIGALALNGRIEEARLWDERTCTLLEASLCNRFLREWVSAPAPAPAVAH
jgi:O-antigen ligase